MSAAVYALRTFHCYLCDHYKSAGEFRRDATRTSGLGSRCRVCDNIKKTERERAQRQHITAASLSESREETNG